MAKSRFDVLPLNTTGRQRRRRHKKLTTRRIAARTFSLNFLRLTGNGCIGGFERPVSSLVGGRAPPWAGFFVSSSDLRGSESEGSGDGIRFVTVSEVGKE